MAWLLCVGIGDFRQGSKNSAVENPVRLTISEFIRKIVRNI